MLTQITINGLAVGCLIGILGLAFSITYIGCRFFAFTFGASYSLAVYAVVALQSALPMPAAVFLGILVAAAIAMGLEAVVFGPLRDRRADSLTLMLASMGLYLAIENTISLVFGDQTRSLWQGDTPAIAVGAAHVSITQLAIIASAFLVTMTTAVLFSTSLTARVMRALSSNLELATAIGLPARRMTLIAVGIGGGLAGIAACLQGFDTGIVPSIGFSAMLNGIVASVVAGPRRPLWAAASGVAVGLLSNYVIVWIGSEWQNGLLFLILGASLLARRTAFAPAP